MPKKRDILDLLYRDELLEILDAHSLSVADRRRKDDVIEAIASSRTTKLDEILGTFKRDKLKGLCRSLGLDDSGKEKAEIIGRLLDGHGGGAVKSIEEQAQLFPEEEAPASKPAKKKAAKGNGAAKKNGSGDLGFEATLWLAADKLRNNLDAAEYKHVVLGLIFLKYISDADEVIDVFAAAGLQQPDISILSDDFLAEVRDLPYKNVAAELLRKLLEDEIKAHSRTNLVKSRAFSEMLDESLKRYRNRAVTTLEVIEELIKIAKAVREDRERGTNLGLNPAEIAFYDALADNESAKELMGEPILVKLAQELAKVIRKNATIDWNLRESVRARMRTLVRRLLRKYKYPPDLQEKATETVLKQAEMLAEELAA